MTAICHPDRPHRAKGLCARCYCKKYYHDTNIVPVRIRVRRRGLVPEYDAWGSIPAKVEGVEQHAVTEFPLSACPKCGNRWLVYHGREAHCAGQFAGCGHTVYLVATSQEEGDQ